VVADPAVMNWGFLGGRLTGARERRRRAFTRHLCLQPASVRGPGAQKPARDPDSGSSKHPRTKIRSIPGQSALANSLGRWVAQDDRLERSCAYHGVLPACAA
jgi:hypothetical protein